MKHILMLPKNTFDKLGFALCIFALFTMTACDSKEIKRKQYYADGQALYKTHCANCHQEKGEGLAGLYPPIAGSDFLTNNKALVLCSMRNGLMDTITVNGKKYHQPMPANTQLQALDVAEIATFIYNEWGGEKTIIGVKDVEEILATCKNKVE